MTQETTGPDADFALTETQNWASRSHRELYEAVHAGNDPGRVGQLADEWNRLSSELAESATRMGERLRATESGWQGEAADAARSAIQQLADWNHEAGTTAGALGERIAVQGQIMETARAEMPEPVGGGEMLNAVAAVTFSTGDMRAFQQACVDLKAHQDRSASAHEQAVQVMTWMEDQSRNIDGDTPKFTPPPNPVTNDEPVQLQKQHVAEEPAELKPQNVGTAPEAPPSSTAPNSAPGEVLETQRLSAKVPFEPPQGGQPGGAPPPLGSTPSMDPPTKSFSAQGLGNTPPPLGTTPSMDPPTKSFSAPPLGSTPSMDPPTKSFRPPELPPLGDYQPKSTTSQGTGGVHPPGNLPPLGEDRQHQPRPFQGPDGGPYMTGPRVNRPGGGPNQPGNQQGPGGWRGSPPPIPGTGGPRGGPVLPNIGPGGGPGSGGPGSGGPGFRGGPVGLSSAGGGSGVGPGGTSGVGPGGVSGTGRGPDGGFVGRGGSGMPGQSGAAGAPGMGPMGAQRGQGDNQDKERTSKYVEGGPVVEVPGADLPPPVIGEGKRKKQQGQ
ncbi:PPE domain-containing protein [Saccharopolyspora shandongensis]|uniref:PPE domain-containing protein n=1 Tax=Saccharopolyspora shandongensis TaxID=418495 RepID=UPI003400EFE2